MENLQGRVQRYFSGQQELDPRGREALRVVRQFVGMIPTAVLGHSMITPNNNIRAGSERVRVVPCENEDLMLDN